MAYFFSVLLLPGTLIHEFSHALAAIFLGVRIAGLSLLPKLDSAAKHLTLGSLSHAKTDFVRSSLIGAAPTLVGLSLVTLLVSTMFTPQSLTLSPIFHSPDTLSTYLKLYLAFAIANTMHTSASDRQSWPILIVTLALLLGLAVYFDLSSIFATSVSTFVSHFGPSVAFALLFTFLLNCVLAFLLFSLRLLFSKTASLLLSL